VDVGIVWGHVPSWNRWNNSLAAGPVTMQDLATQDQLPEYVYVGEMRGSELVGRRGGPAAWSLLADKTEPGYMEGKMLTVADIQPGKTYRVASGFHGAPSYGAEPGKMPRLFKWTTPEEFLAGPGAHIPVRNLLQTPLQTAEAVAKYVLKHKTIAPRATGFSLTDYIVNPRDNEYGGSDWLHLGVDVARQPGSTSTGRYTLNLGVRAAGQPEAAPPRKNAKQFAELALNGAPVNFDFSALDKKLPLTVTSTLTRQAVTVNKEGKTYALVAAGTQDSVGQAVLAELQLANKGQADVAVTAVLSDTVMLNIEGQTWPEDSAKGKAWYAGYHRAIGQSKQPPRHEEAVLLLGEAKPRKLVAPNAGFNFGLVGIAQELTVKAGQSLTLPLLLISINRPDSGPDINLQTALEAVKQQLLTAGTKPD
jgi:hypothetical protein